MVPVGPGPTKVVRELGVASEVFYGQRGKIRRTKEQEMISAIMDLMEHRKSGVWDEVVMLINVCGLIMHYR